MNDAALPAPDIEPSGITRIADVAHARRRH
jgi:hypothetical protein